MVVDANKRLVLTSALKAFSKRTDIQRSSTGKSSCSLA